jgi:GPH family glycoside/pentoside/hexuronide:cation symporter
MLLGGAQKGYFYYFSICAILAGISMFATFLGTEEKIKPIKSDKKLPFGQALKMTLHNKWWLISMGLQLGVFSLITLQSVSMYYITYIIGNMNLLTLIMSITFVSQFIMPFIFKPVVDKLGKIKATGISLLIASVGFLIPLIDITSITLLVAASVFRGLGISGSSTTRCAITADVLDYGEWKTSHRLDAIIFSGNSIAAKVGMGLSGMLIMLILNASGYIGGTATQTPEALSSIVFMYTWLNVIIIGISSIFLLALHSLEQEMENIQKDLTQREI